MSFDYFEDLEDFGFPDLDPDDPVSAREAVVETLVDCNLEVPEPELSDDEIEELPEHVLFGWQYDHDMSLSLFAIPVADLSDELGAAMKRANTKAYAHHELTLGDESAQAYVRLDAAMGLELVDDYFKAFANDIDDDDIDCLGTYRIAYIEQDEEPEFAKGAFDRNFVAAYSVRRAQ